MAPGYPLSVMLGRLMSLLPGSPAGNVNALSGIFSATCASIFFLTLRRLDLKALPAATATALMALCPLFWFYSEVAEVRALNNLLAMGSAYASLAWAQDKNLRALWLLSATMGLGLSHHPTFVLILPALAYYLWKNGPKLRPHKALLAFFLMVFCAALPYLILGLRLHAVNPLYNPSEVRTWGGVWELFWRLEMGGPLRVVAGNSISSLAHFEFGRFLEHSGWFLSSWPRQLTLPGLLLATIGVFALFAKQRKTLAFWCLWLVCTSLPFILLSSQQMVICDQDYLRALLMRFYLLPLIALFALAGFGVQWLLDRARPTFGWALLAAAMFIPLLFGAVNLRGHDQLLDYARAILASSGPSDMIILAADDSIFALSYLEIIEKKAADRVFLTPSLFSYPPYIRRLQETHRALVVPPLGREGLVTDWDQWMRLNPLRKIYAEPVLRDTILTVFPKSAPSGVLIELRRTPAARNQIAAEAENLMDWPPLSLLSRQSLYVFTQEIYLLKAYSTLLEFYGSFLGVEHGLLKARIEDKLASL
jgi:hypothetical protein